MRLIEVTRDIDKKKVYVNPEKICFICPYYGRATSVIQFSGGDENYIEVIESAKEIARMVYDS